MSSSKGYIIKRVLLFIFFAALILLYGVHYASIKLSPSFRNILSVKTLGEAFYDSKVNQNEFEDQWCKAMKEARNWGAIIRPCLDLLTWESRQSLPKSLETDPELSFIAGKDVRPAGEFSRITIVTKSKRGDQKNIGGDSWRVKVNGTASINSRVIDHSNGTYEVLLFIMDQGVYFLYIFLDYSLCNGLRDPPKDWFKKGNGQGKYQGVDVIGTPKDLLLQPIKGTPIRIDIKESRARGGNTAPTCSNACTMLWDGRGRWKNSTWIPYFNASTWKHKEKIKRAPNERGSLIVYGDSVNVFFAQSLMHRRRVCGGAFRSCSFLYNWIYQIKNITTAKTLRDSNDIDIRRIQNDFESTVKDPAFNHERSLLIVNFGLHFVESTNFSNYQKLIDGLAKVLTEKDDTGQSKYKGKVIWKTTTAINKERADYPHLHWRRFFTNYRILLYNAYAVDVMCKHGISIADVYDISASYPFGTGTHAGRTPSKNDIVHYNNEAFYPLEEFIEKYF